MELPADVRTALEEYNQTDAGRDACIWFLGNVNGKPAWALGRRLNVHPEVRAAAAQVYEERGVSDQDRHFAQLLHNGLKPTFVREGKITPADVAELKRLRYRWVEERKEVEAEMDALLTRSVHVQRKKDARVKYIAEVLKSNWTAQTRRFIQGDRSIVVPDTIS